MDITNNIITITTTTTSTPSSSSSWDLDMTMGNHLLLDHQIQSPSSYEFLNTSLDQHFHAHTQLPSPTFPTPSQFTTLQREVESDNNHEDDEEEGLGAMKEMMYKIAAMQPVDIDPSSIKKPKRRNVRISDDPQSIAARHRRERISERIRILQRLVPGGTKMDTASMLDEAIRYVKFLKRQVQELQANPPQPPQAMAQVQVGVMSGHPVGAIDWSSVRPDSHGLGSSLSSSAMGGHPGLGFVFPCEGPSDHHHPMG